MGEDSVAISEFHWVAGPASCNANLVLYSIILQPHCERHDSSFSSSPDYSCVSGSGTSGEGREDPIFYASQWVVSSPLTKDLHPEGATFVLRLKLTHPWHPHTALYSISICDLQPTRWSMGLSSLSVCLSVCQGLFTEASPASPSAICLIVWCQWHGKRGRISLKGDRPRKHKHILYDFIVLDEVLFQICKLASSAHEI